MLRSTFRLSESKIKQWETFDLDNFLEPFENKPIPESYAAELLNIFCTSNSSLCDLLYVAEAELGITSHFRNYLIELVEGIQGKENNGEKLQKQQAECLKYLSERNLGPEEGCTGVEEHTFFLLYNLFHGYLPKETGIKCLQRMILKKNNEDSINSIELVSLSICDGYHTINMAKGMKGIYLFNTNGKPKKTESFPEIEEGKNSFSSIYISKELNESLSSIKIDLENWYKPNQKDNNCYFCAALIRFSYYLLIYKNYPELVLHK